jgi:heterodisulfide reductase subunit B2
MRDPQLKKPSYFPGCSLATTAKENDHSLHVFCEQHGIQLEELDDWNCCGSSSTHSIDHDLAVWLPTRNLALTPPDRKLLVACPSCYQRLKLSQMDLKKSEHSQKIYYEMWGRKFNPDLQIITFFDLLSDMVDEGMLKAQTGRLNEMRIAPYYGCMLSRPPSMRTEKNFHGFMEKVLASMGATPLRWNNAVKCCGTFLSVSRPDIASRNVQAIIDEAESVKADCIVTACSMCHLNLEIRSKLPGKIPILHFSEILSLSSGIGSGMGWFQRHLIDPRPMLKSKRLIA